MIIRTDDVIHAAGRNVDVTDVVHTGHRWCWGIEELRLIELVELQSYSHVQQIIVSGPTAYTMYNFWDCTFCTNLLWSLELEFWSLKTWLIFNLLTYLVTQTTYIVAASSCLQPVVKLRNQEAGHAKLEVGNGTLSFGSLPWSCTFFAKSIIIIIIINITVY